MRYKAFIFFIFFLFSSCGHHNQKRLIASQTGSCLEMTSQLIQNKRVQLRNLENHEIRTSFDFSRTEINELMRNKFYQNHIFRREKTENLEQSALIVALIKRSRPDFDEKRVLMRYRRLFKMCNS